MYRYSFSLLCVHKLLLTDLGSYILKSGYKYKVNVYVILLTTVWLIRFLAQEDNRSVYGLQSCVDHPGKAINDSLIKNKKNHLIFINHKRNSGHFWAPCLHSCK